MTPEKSLEARIDEAAKKWIWGNGFHSTKDESFKAGAQFMLPLIEKARLEGRAEMVKELSNVLDKMAIAMELK